MSGQLVDRIWYGRSASDRALRALLRPAGWAYAGATAVRNALYDRGVLATHLPAVPSLAIGNLSVGGTGKTPVAAWAARALQDRGARPAIVLRGYGDDEPLVHARLNPGVIVVADPDRVRGVAEATRRGADCAVLDDAFQHRRVGRIADWVLVAAEGWRNGAGRLPAGPLRESEGALGRASLLVVTRKTASLDEAEALASSLSRHVRNGAHAVVHLSPHSIVPLDGEAQPISAIRGRRFAAVAAIGAPQAFFAQLRALGGLISETAYRDHHRFTPDDTERIRSAARGTEGVLCTLKDAVKLAPLWRGADAPLWYVSQAVTVDRGASTLDASLEAVLMARVQPFHHAGSAGPSVPDHGHRSSTADR